MRGLAISIGSLVALSLTFVPGAARAFNVGTSVTKACHELMTRRAVDESNVQKPEGWPRQWPNQDETWLKLARWLEEEGLIEPRDDRWRLLQVSLFLGARYPDQRGFGITDLQGMREIHLSDNDQQAHSLRAQDQDGSQGDRLTVESTRALIRELVRTARSPTDTWSMSGRMKSVSVWIEFYGQVDVVVWEPAFLMARALHTMQDSFAHTYRSPDLTRIYTVCNYLDALAGDYDEVRDGPRHSTFVDDCDREEVEPLVDAAISASTDLFNAGLEYMNTNDMAVVDRALDKWLTLEPGCTVEAGYCGTPWAALARREETHPLGCTYGGGTCPATLATLTVLGLIALSRRRK